MSSIVINDVTVESRESDNFINATQLCEAGGKRFDDWCFLPTTTQLTMDLGTCLYGKPWPLKSLMERGSESWIHPKLAVQLADWISPSFAILISQWIDKPSIVKPPSVDSEKSNEVIATLQKQLRESKARIAVLENKQIVLDILDKNATALTKDQTFYIATTRNDASQNIFRYSGTSNSSTLMPMITLYNAGLSGDDKLYYTKLFKCNNYMLIEARVKSVLCQFKDETHTGEQSVRMPYNLLVDVVGYICDNYDREIEYINSKCDQFMHDPTEYKAIIPEQINPDTISETKSNGWYHLVEKC